MNTQSLLKTAQGIALLALGASALDASASSGRGTALDNRCATLPAQAAAPQQSKPYLASGRSCLLCHTSSNASANNLNAAGQATRTGGNVALMDPYCINTRPSASITAPAANGASFTPGGVVTFTGSGADPDGFTLSYAWALSNGAALSGQTANYTVPTNATPGTVTATLTVTDPDGATPASPPTRTFTIAAAPTPTAPTASAESYTVQAGVTLAIPAPGVLSNDSGSAPLTAVLNSTVAHGSLTLSANGGFNYTPAAGYTGPDSFSYKASNSVGSSAAATVTLTVNAAPATGPAANADSYATTADKALTVAAPGVLANDTGGTLSAQIATQPANAKVFSFRTDGGFSYTPKSGYTGTDTFTYQAKLGAQLSAAATVSIRVTSAGPCIDKDQDGYSPEGKSCGPIDCNDNNAAVTTCNATKACIDTLLAKAVRIDSAVWSGNKLTVAGSKAAKKASVQIYDAVSAVLLGTVKAEDSGAWKFERERLGAAPCRVRVDINGASGQLKVNGAPASCVSSGEPVCASGGGQDDDDGQVSESARSSSTSGKKRDD
ncbi:MAG: Ig-like domain-containing protein [Candidatus Methylumidiphilus sp.]